MKSPKLLLLALLIFFGSTHRSSSQQRDVENFLKSFNDSNYEEADKHLNLILERDSLNIPANFYKARLAALLGDYKRGMKHINIAISQNPNNSNFYMVRCLLKQKSGDYQTESMLIDIDKAIDISPEKYDYKRYKASILVENGKYDEAIKLYDLLIEVFELNINYRNFRAYALCRAKKFKQVKKDIEFVLERRPNDFTANEVLGFYYMGKEKYVDAVKQFQKLSELNLDSLSENEIQSHRCNSLSNLGYAQFKNGNIAEAFETIEKAQLLLNTSPYPVYIRAKTYIENGNYDDGCIYLNKAKYKGILKSTEKFEFNQVYNKFCGQ